MLFPQLSGERMDAPRVKEGFPDTKQKCSKPYLVAVVSHFTICHYQACLCLLAKSYFKELEHTNVSVSSAVSTS